MSSPYGYSPPPYGGQSHNPYAAPQAFGSGGFGSPAFGPVGGGPIAFRSHAGWHKWAYLGALLGGYAIAILGAVVGNAADEDVGVAIAVIGIMLAFFGRLVFALTWLGAAWQAIPPDYRVTSTGKRVSPGEAVGFLFIPFFNIYWMFVASGGLCDALDYMLRSSGTGRSAPKGTSLAACIFQFVPYLNILVAPFIWFFFMLQFDGAAKELENASNAAPAPAGFGGGGFAPPAGGYGGAAY